MATLKKYTEDAFWMAKMRHSFYCWLDLDRNGFIEKKDFDLKFEVMMSQTQWKKCSPMWWRTKRMTDALWNGIKEVADANKDEKVSLSEYCAFCAATAERYNNDKDLPSWLLESIDVYFALLDKTGDGWLDLEEFIGYYHKVARIPVDVVTATYNKITKDGSRGFDLDLYREMRIGFTTSFEMGSPGNIYGEMLVKQIGWETEFKRTQFWVDKKKHEFYTLDADQNKVAEENDINLITQGLIAATGWVEGSPKWKELKEAYGNYWKELLHFADTNQDGKVTLDEWLVFWEATGKAVYSRQKEMPKWYIDYINITFDVFDKNGDGWVSKEEFRYIYGEYGLQIPNQVIDKCYDDVTYGGRIPMDRAWFVEMCIQFCISTDEFCPGNILGRMLLNYVGARWLLEPVGTS